MNNFYFYQDKEQRILVGTASRKDTLSLPPSYDSIIKIDNATNFNKLNKSRYLNSGRKSSHATGSDSDGAQVNGVSTCPKCL
jgi:hypothetical protein